jgi:predicted ATP-grasp superfamily ATP-dependent carboligase
MIVLIIYGYRPHWTNFIDDKLLPFFNNKINQIKIYNDEYSLKKYLTVDGVYNKNYILPLVESNMIELTNMNINAMMPRIDIIDIFSNKKKFSDYTINNNLQKYTPKIFTSIQGSPELVIVKPFYGAASYGTYLSELNKLESNIFENNIVQKYIDTTTEYAAYLVVNNGNIIYSFAYYRIYPKTPYIKGHNDTTIQYRCGINIEHLNILEKFLKPINYTGTCCIDYKLYNNIPIVFEINPRLGLSLSYESNKQDAANIILKMMEIF